MSMSDFTPSQQKYLNNLEDGAMLQVLGGMGTYTLYFKHNGEIKSIYWCSGWPTNKLSDEDNALLDMANEKAKNQTLIRMIKNTFETM